MKPRVGIRHCSRCRRRPVIRTTHLGPVFIVVAVCHGEVRQEILDPGMLLPFFRGEHVPTITLRPFA